MQRQMRSTNLYLMLLAVLLTACVPTQTAILKPAKAHMVGIAPSSAHADAILWQHCTQVKSKSVCDLRPIDPQTGQSIAGYTPIDAGSYSTVGFTSDRRMLAMLAFPDNMFTNSGGPARGMLRFVDLATWHSWDTGLIFNDSPVPPLFSPDGLRLVIASSEWKYPLGEQHNLLTWIDVSRGVTITQRALDLRPINMQFTPDGQQLMIYGSKSDPQKREIINPRLYVMLIDAHNFSEVWQHELAGVFDGPYAAQDKDLYDPHSNVWWHPAVVFEPEGNKLYIVHADKNQLTMVDFSQRTLTNQTIGKRQGLLERLLSLSARTAYAKIANGTSKQAILAKGGKRLFVTGLERSYVENQFMESQYKERSLGIQVIDLATARELKHIDVPAQRLSLSADGAQVIAHSTQMEASGEQWVDSTVCINSSTYAVGLQSTGWAVHLNQRLDGEWLALASRHLGQPTQEIGVFDLQTMQVHNRWRVTDKSWGWFLIK